MDKHKKVFIGVVLAVLGAVLVVTVPLVHLGKLSSVVPILTGLLFSGVFFTYMAFKNGEHYGRIR